MLRVSSKRKRFDVMLRIEDASRLLEAIETLRDRVSTI